MNDSTTHGFVDLQVNGYGGVDFNQDGLTPEALHHACDVMRRDGVTHALATIITEDLSVMSKRLTRLAELRDRDDLVASVVAGFHVEGPFINETDGYRGAHPLDAVRPASVEAMAELVEAGQGLVRLVTLAPERDGQAQTTRWLADRGILVAAGHCNPSLDELDAALDAGLSLFTHLGNGCPMQMHRHDNIVQRALSRADRMRLCFIADGAHVAFFALRNYVRAAGAERCVLVSDAVAPAGLGPGRYTLGRWELDIGEDLVARAPDGSHLVGSALGMSRGYENLYERAGLTRHEAELLAKFNPAELLG